jgi:hypothetical protein
MTVVAKKRRTAEVGCQGVRSRVKVVEKEVVLLLWSMERVTAVEIEERYVEVEGSKSKIELMVGRGQGKESSEGSRGGRRKVGGLSKGRDFGHRRQQQTRAGQARLDHPRNNKTRQDKTKRSGGNSISGPRGRPPFRQEEPRRQLSVAGRGEMDPAV